MAIIILGALVALYTTNHQFYNMASIFTELRGYTKNFKNQFSKDVEEAVAVATSQSLGGTTYTTSSTELVLKCYAKTATGFDTGYFDYIAYRVTSNKIVRVVDADTHSIRGDSSHDLIERVYSLSFRFYDHNETLLTSGYTTASRIAISLDVRKTWAGKERRETILSSARLRNKRS